MTEAATPELRPERERPGLRLLALLCGLLVAAVVGLTATQVTLRYVFNNPQSWAEEVGRYLFVWLVFLGAAVAFARDTHIKVDALTSRLGARARRITDLLRRLVELVACGVLLYSGILVAWSHRTGSFYTLPGMPQVIFYLAVPVGTLIALFYVLRGLVRWTRG